MKAFAISSLAAAEVGFACCCSCCCCCRRRGGEEKGIQPWYLSKGGPPNSVGSLEGSIITYPLGDTRVANTASAEAGMSTGLSARVRSIPEVEKGPETAFLSMIMDDCRGRPSPVIEAFR